MAGHLPLRGAACTQSWPMAAHGALQLLLALGERRRVLGHIKHHVAQPTPAGFVLARPGPRSIAPLQTGPGPAHNSPSSAVRGQPRTNHGRRADRQALAAQQLLARPVAHGCRQLLADPVGLDVQLAVVRGRPGSASGPRRRRAPATRRAAGPMPRAGPRPGVWGGLRAA